ncbi:carbohydrate ABC transporter permease [Leifsonia sp. LS-T14]|uniref:carbohydrate ABC transporter permease n=1 Tax=unclassified Leifsonia TaxID=2663824 RepID=UPI0035A59FBE
MSSSTITAGGARVRSTGPSGWYIVPALAVFVLFAFVPLVVALWLSFTSWDAISAPTFVGADNWVQALSANGTWHSLWLTLEVVVFSWIIQTPISLLLGVFVAGHQRYRAVLAAIYFLPLILSSAAIGIAFKAILDPNFGLADSLGIPWLKQNWLGDPTLILFMVVFVIAWQFVPLHTLLYQGGARQIPASLYEAAQIDGASRMQQFFSITLPQLKFTIITSSTLMITGSLTYFDVVFILTGGVPSDAINILPINMYVTGFSASQFGMASVLAIILAVIGLVVSLVLTKFSGFNRMSSQQEGA